MLFIAGFVAGFSLQEIIETQWIVSQQPCSLPRVCFTPGQNCSRLVIREIKLAQQEILVQAYSLTSQPIVQALIEAHNRGIKVEILSDKSRVQEVSTQVQNLKQAGIRVFIDHVPGIAHNKVMILDRKKLLTGSFNWTQGAQTRNSENLLLLQNPGLIEAYIQNWLKRKESATLL